MQLHGITCNLANKTFLETLSKKDCYSTRPDNTSYSANNSRHLVLDAAKILYFQCSGLWGLLCHVTLLSMMTRFAWCDEPNTDGLGLGMRLLNTRIESRENWTPGREKRETNRIWVGTEKNRGAVDIFGKKWISPIHFRTETCHLLKCDKSVITLTTVDHD